MGGAFYYMRWYQTITKPFIFAGAKQKLHQNPLTRVFTMDLEENSK